MHPSTKQAGAALCLMAMGFFAAIPFWKWVYTKPVRSSMRERTQEIVEGNPQLKPAWEVAIQDGVLTRPEAKIIFEAAGEKTGLEE